MPFPISDLLFAERSGRTIAASLQPHPEQTWRIRIAPGPMGAACAVAARWADRYSAKVGVVFTADAFQDPVVKAMSTVCERLGLNDVPDDKPLLVPNHIEVTCGRSLRMVESLLPDELSWGTPLHSPAGTLSVRLAGSGDRPLSCAASRGLDRRAIEEYDLPGLCLMENAGVGAVMVAADMIAKSPRRGSVVVVAGGGNNAGDGFVVARGLAALGRSVTVALAKDPASLSPDAAANYRLLDGRKDVTFVRVDADPDTVGKLAGDAVLVVDALLGTGFTGGLSPVYAEIIDRVNAANKQVLALDLPSGLSGDSGTAEQETIRASRTVTFANVKTGHLVGSGPELCGLLYIAEIGLPRPILPQ